MQIYFLRHRSGSWTIQKHQSSIPRWKISPDFYFGLAASSKQFHGYRSFLLFPPVSLSLSLRCSIHRRAHLPPPIQCVPGRPQIALSHCCCPVVRALSLLLSPEIVDRIVTRTAPPYTGLRARFILIGPTERDSADHENTMTIIVFNSVGTREGASSPLPLHPLLSLHATFSHRTKFRTATISWIAARDFPSRTIKSFKARAVLLQIEFPEYFSLFFSFFFFFTQNQKFNRGTCMCTLAEILKFLRWKM